MSEEKKIAYEELQTEEFFNKAVSFTETASKKISVCNEINCKRLAGRTVIQAFIGHPSLIKKSLKQEDVKSVYTLFKNTNTFLKTIGVTFADIDEMMSKKVENAC